MGYNFRLAISLTTGSQLAKCREMNVGKPLDIQATLAGFVLPAVSSDHGLREPP